MARGIWSGMAAGAVFSMLGLGTLSILNPLEPAVPSEAEQGSETEIDGSGMAELEDRAEPVASDPALEQSEPADTADRSPVGVTEVEMPMPPETSEDSGFAPAPNDSPAEGPMPMEGDDEIVSMPGAITDPPAAPEVGTVNDNLSAPESASEIEAEGAMQGTAEDPILPSPQAAQPDAPSVEEALDVSTAPAEPVEPAEPVIIVDDDAPAADVPEAVILVDPQQAEAATAQEGETEDEPEAGGAIPALQAFAAEPGPLDGRPLMAVILIDDGTMPAAGAALAGLPFPVTIALDPAQESAAEAMMAQYREEGHEIAALAPALIGASADGVEAALAAGFATLPETVALLDIGNGPLANDRDLAESAAAYLATEGRGYITLNEDFGGVGAEAGIAVSVIYQDLDPDDQDARVIRRFIDQAAFRARQESGVVLLGRVRPDTISALILWSAANPDLDIQIVPVSAVLSEGQ